MLKGFVTAFAAVFACAPASAAITIYSDPDAFKAALPTYQQGTFDYDTGITDNLPLGSSVTYGPMRFSGSNLTAWNDAFFTYNGTQISASYLATYRDPLPLRIQSSQRGLGLYLSSYGGGEYQILFNSRGETGSITSPIAWQASFFGIIDTSDSVDVTLAPTAPFQDIAIAAYIAAQVPEPATWAMMIAGFGLLGPAASGREGRMGWRWDCRAGLLTHA